MVQSGQVLRPDVSCSHWVRRWTDAVDQFRPRVVVVMESTWDLIPRADGTDPATLAASIYQKAATILERHGAQVFWVKPVDPSPLSPVPPAERPGRIANAVALGGVIDHIPGDHLVPLSLGAPGSDGVVQLTRDQLEAAATRLAANLGG
jgi:hypothetical protein